MDGKTVDWQDIERLANVMVRSGIDFSEADKRALELVFEAAGDQLTGRREAQSLGTVFDPGTSSRKARAAFKVSGLYRADDEPTGN
ncbi:hypothetical protein [Streptomyces sp. NPDC057253]|uniref:hypothetical protein n=1 Tax=Streptomyces sp. NPDC057253 TaxID=3346069 RepID=UPI003644E102